MSCPKTLHTGGQSWEFLLGLIGKSGTAVSSVFGESGVVWTSPNTRPFLVLSANPRPSPFHFCFLPCPLEEEGSPQTHSCLFTDSSLVLCSICHQSPASTPLINHSVTSAPQFPVLSYSLTHLLPLPWNACSVMSQPSHLHCSLQNHENHSFKLH